MADTISNPSMEPLYFSVDPMSDTHQLKLLLDGFSGFERGARYDEYSRLRESKLRMKRDFQKFMEEEPRKKQVRFEEDKKKQMRRAPSSSLAQSVPDFSGLIRKENRRPVDYNTTPPPPSSKTRNGGVFSRSASSSAAVRGSKSASVGEKKSRGMMGKSYASFEDVKKISMAAASAINGAGGARIKAGSGRTILGYKQIY